MGATGTHSHRGTRDLHRGALAAMLISPDLILGALAVAWFPLTFSVVHCFFWLMISLLIHLSVR